MNKQGGFAIGGLAILGVCHGADWSFDRGYGSATVGLV